MSHFYGFQPFTRDELDNLVARDEVILVNVSRFTLMSAEKTVERVTPTRIFVVGVDRWFRRDNGAYSIPLGALRDISMIVPRTPANLARLYEIERKLDESHRREKAIGTLRDSVIYGDSRNHFPTEVLESAAAVLNAWSESEQVKS